MELSVCIVSYECRDKLRACLESIRAHRPTVEHEIIVVDNGSTDGTVEMINQDFYWVTLIANEENRGFSPACNQGFAAASGKVLMILNPDTEVSRGVFDDMLKFVTERPWIGAVGPKLVGEDGEPETSCREFPTLMNAVWDFTGLSRAFSHSKVFGHYEMSWWDHSKPRAIDWVSAAALMFTRKAWEKAGPLDENFLLLASELDWEKRLQRAGLERWYLPTVQITHHHGRSWGGDEAEEIVPLHLAAFRFFRKHHGVVSAMSLRLIAQVIFLPRTLGSLIQAIFPSAREQALRELRVNWAVYRTAIGLPPSSAKVL